MHLTAVSWWRRTGCRELSSSMAGRSGVESPCTCCPFTAVIRPFRSRELYLGRQMGGEGVSDFKRIYLEQQTPWGPGKRVLWHNRHTETIHVVSCYQCQKIQVFNTPTLPARLLQGSFSGDLMRPSECTLTSSLTPYHLSLLSAPSHFLMACGPQIAASDPGITLSQIKSRTEFSSKLTKAHQTIFSYYRSYHKTYQSTSK